MTYKVDDINRACGNMVREKMNPHRTRKTTNKNFPNFPLPLGEGQGEGFS